MKKLMIALFVLALGVGFSGRAYAATEATTLDVSVTMVAGCTVSTTGVIWPDSDGSADVGTLGNVAVNCTEGTNYSIALGGGLNPGVGYRTVSDGAGNYIDYELRREGAYLWGDAGTDYTFPSGGYELVDIGNGNIQNHTVYALLFASGVVAGAYTDVVNVTVYY